MVSESADIDRPKGRPNFGRWSVFFAEELIGFVKMLHGFTVEKKLKITNLKVLQQK